MANHKVENSNNTKGTQPEIVENHSKGTQTENLSKGTPPEKCIVLPFVIPLTDI